jgi:hypothetical protein
MSPEQIQQLVRMTEEIEAMERSIGEEADAPIPFPVALHAAVEAPATSEAPAPLPFRRPLRRSRAWSWLAAAASLGIVAAVAWNARSGGSRPTDPVPRIIVEKPTPAPSLPDSRLVRSDVEEPVAVDPEPVIGHAIRHAAYTPADSTGCEPADPSIASVVFAIARDVEAGCGDRQHIIQAFAPGPNGRLGRAELLRMGYEATGISTPDRLLVVSVSGPVDQLPHTPSEAEALLACMDLSKSDPETAAIVGELGHDEAKYAAAARACLSDGVLVEAATLMGR